MEATSPEVQDFFIKPDPDSTTVFPPSNENIVSKSEYATEVNVDEALTVQFEESRNENTETTFIEEDDPFEVIRLATERARTQNQKLTEDTQSLTNENARLKIENKTLITKNETFKIEKEEFQRQIEELKFELLIL